MNTSAARVGGLVVGGVLVGGRVTVGGGAAVGQAVTHASSDANATGRRHLRTNRPPAYAGAGAPERAAHACAARPPGRPAGLGAEGSARATRSHGVGAPGRWAISLNHLARGVTSPPQVSIPAQLPRRPRRIAAALAAALACAPASDDDASDDDPSGGKADALDPADFGCQAVEGIALEALVDVDDPIAAFLIKGARGCAADYREMVAMLAAVDPEGCEPGRELITRFVSDDARIDPNPDNYRTVTSRACGSRPPHALLFTLLAVKPGEDLGRRTFIEMQALDRRTGLYDYWVFSSGRFEFKGDSLAAAAGTSNCGRCHRDGGVLMKELDDPWLHWESSGKPLPGVDALFAAHGAMLGQRGDGRELEALVRVGNDAIIAARIDAQTKPTGKLATLLRPLFCSEQINLDAAGTTIDGPVSAIPADALLDPLWGMTTGVTIESTAYDAAVKAAGQVVPGVSGRVDTEFKFAFPERAGFDVAYVRALIDRGIIDEAFALDVLAVDFTRPLFSDARCGLLAFAPTSGDATPTRLREGFVTALQAAAPAAGTPAAELLANLGDTDDSGSHRTRVAAFAAACDARDDRAFVDDVLRVTQLSRELLRTTTSLIEHPEQLPRTELPVSAAAHLDPATCALVQ
ncbi:MAG: hypothetical protein IPK74_09050 [Deltaproteobacteria bacterium]|nr:hypothetical protein [Deltaproteobacteria bacterium]